MLAAGGWRHRRWSWSRRVAVTALDGFREQTQHKEEGLDLFNIPNRCGDTYICHVGTQAGRYPNGTRPAPRTTPRKWPCRSRIESNGPFYCLSPDNNTEAAGGE